MVNVVSLTVRLSHILSVIGPLLISRAEDLTEMPSHPCLSPIASNGFSYHMEARVKLADGMCTALYIRPRTYINYRYSAETEVKVLVVPQR